MFMLACKQFLNGLRVKWNQLIGHEVKGVIDINWWFKGEASGNWHPHRNCVKLLWCLRVIWELVVRATRYYLARSSFIDQKLFMQSFNCSHFLFESNDEIFEPSFRQAGVLHLGSDSQIRELINNLNKRVHYLGPKILIIKSAWKRLHVRFWSAGGVYWRLELGKVDDLVSENGSVWGIGESVLLLTTRDFLCWFHFTKFFAFRFGKSYCLSNKWRLCSFRRLG